MGSATRSAERLRTWPVVLIAAVVQGGALYLLHHALEERHWPADSPAWLFALYASAVFVPLTVQLLAAHAHARACWILVGTLAVLLACCGWHQGAKVATPVLNGGMEFEYFFGFAVVAGVLWLSLLPFMQGRLASGTWRITYAELFATAWRNKCLLAEAILFTGLFGLLLVLWQALFSMVGIRFFRELFAAPMFFYPVAALAFGLAVQLIGSVERLTSIVLEQSLNVLKWLAIVAGLMLVLFSAALALKLPGLVFDGERAVSAAWLLWLVAVIVLLVNAAYRDGTVIRPYPQWLALALRFAIPLTVLIAATALYALYVRIHNYGLTVDRVWALIVACAALLYSIGYGLAALRGGAWMADIARVNVAIALGLSVVLTLTLTPILSPYRLAANSQYRMALALQPDRPTGGYQAPLEYLRSNAGRYGRERLQALAKLSDHPRAAALRAAAQRLLAQESRSSPPPPADVDKLLADLVLYPSGRALDSTLRERLRENLRERNSAALQLAPGGRYGGVYLDLNGDGDEEFVLLRSGDGYVYEKRAEGWHHIGVMYPRGIGAPGEELQALLNGDVTAQRPQWRELRLGTRTYRLGR